MSRIRPAFALIFFAMLPAPVFADLGENEEQLEKRFGKPYRVVDDRNKTAPAEKTLKYKTKEFTVFVALLNGKSAYEEYEFNEEIGGSEDPKVKAVLDRQAMGGTWDVFPKPKLIGEDRKHCWARLGAGKANMANAQVRTTSPKVLELQTHEFTLLLQ